MSLDEPGWLEQLLRQVVSTHTFDDASASAAACRALPPGRGRARRYLRGILRESGLLYGTPQQSGDAKGAGPEEQLFLAVLRVFATLALDVAKLADAAPGPRPEQLLVLFAVLTGELDVAEELHQRIVKAHKSWPLPRKRWLHVEEALARRALSLAADPYYGLVLHNGALYADAQLFGRVAIAYFGGPASDFPRVELERRLHFSSLLKSKLVEVLVGLVSAERKPGFPARRAILRQIDDLLLPEALAEHTADFARRAFNKPVPVKRLVQGLRSRDMKRFILEQTVLASLVDGRRSAREMEWTRELGAALGFTPEQLRTTELEMAAYYAKHRHLVDVFSLAHGAEMLGEEWVDEFSVTMKKNYRALLRELKETGELSVLLSRAARGQKLTGEEKKVMREQLIDVAKVVPALAIFAAPGGVLLLLALAKVFKFDLRPSAFHDDQTGD